MDSSSRPQWTRPVARWILPEAPDSSVTDLQNSLKLSRLVAAVLAARGLTDLKDALAFLQPSLDALHDPFLMLGMNAAVERLLAAIKAKEKILLYGDYDVDGTSSIVVLLKALEVLGQRAEFHIPNRLTDGYGMRNDVMDRAAQSGVRLIVSVDTGIRANSVVRYANELGIDVIVTDHHLPDADLPPATAVLNPNRPGCEYPEKGLCGAGVAFKLIQGLLTRSGLGAPRRAALLDSFLKLVAIATVADIVPLTGENRVIVRRGLAGLREVRNAGLRSLLAVAGFEAGECPSAHQVAFRLAPRINAAGRMASALDVVELFLSEDLNRTRELAEQLDAQNRDRQNAETEIVHTILRQCEDEPITAGSRALVFEGSGWHLGVLGIVASRLVERFHRPVFVLSDAADQEANGGRQLSGSGRSIPAFHLLDALESMPELFSKFGGHRQAAGLTLPASRLDSFRERFNSCAAARLTSDDLRPNYTADAEVCFTELNDRSVDQLMALGPFGFGNPAPVFYTAQAEVAGPIKLLADGKHVTVPLAHNGRTLFCKGWNFGERAEIFTRGNKLDVLFQVEDDASGKKRGYGSWCVSLKDVRASGG